MHLSLKWLCGQLLKKEGLANKITDEDIQNKWDELYQEGDFESEEDMKSQYTDEEIRQEH